jgi:RNA polymerase sigma-70 factor, ECF subfamily
VDRDDQGLVERSQGGDLAAFETLVEKYRQRVWRLAFNVLRDREEAWDVAQEAFIRAWQALASFRGQSAFYTWLFRIAMNAASDRLRQRGARGRAFGTERVGEEEMERTMADTDETPEERAARVEQRARIDKALATLSDHHRTIIMLSDLEGLSYREIAEVLEIPMGTVMSRLHNARKKLRDVLGPMLALLFAILLGLMPLALSAQQTVRFGCRVVLAGDAPPPAGTPVVPPPTEERLQRVLPRLREMFKFKDYTWLDRHRASVVVGDTQRWPIPGGRQIEITPESVVGDAVRMRVKLVRGGTTEIATNMQIASGYPAVIGGPKHGDGVLIIIVWANTKAERE